MRRYLVVSFGASLLFYFACFTFMKSRHRNGDAASTKYGGGNVSKQHSGLKESSQRILCFLLVGPSTHSNAKHVRDTWGKRCDTLLFFSTKADPELETTPLDVKEGYGFLWAKLKETLRYLYAHHRNYDWFLKTDDDTFIILENLRFFLKSKNPNSAAFYGVKFRKFVQKGYMSGGGGYVLSREALKRFVEDALQIEDEKLCPTKSEKGAEDVQLGQCLSAVGVEASDSLDGDGRPVFFSHSPLALFYKGTVNSFHWYWRYLWNKHEIGPECCSPDLISFHQIDPRMMWTLEFLLYTLRIHKELQPVEILTYSTREAIP